MWELYKCCIGQARGGGSGWNIRSWTTPVAPLHSPTSCQRLHVSITRASRARNITESMWCGFLSIPAWMNSWYARDCCCKFGVFVKVVLCNTLSKNNQVAFVKSLMLTCCGFLSQSLIQSSWVLWPSRKQSRIAWNCSAWGLFSACRISFSEDVLYIYFFIPQFKYMNFIYS